MTVNYQELRLEGIYRQKQEEYVMQRVKLAAGTLSSQQARTVAHIAEEQGKGVIHLTSRGNMEIHWLRLEALQEIKSRMAGVGLTGRGACGGAVRGVTCSSQEAAEFPLLEALARRIQRHFTANPRFEGLPKKFKIGIEASEASRRHLIQDAGLVLVRHDEVRGWYDLWVGGGLGREPRPAILLEREVPEERLIPLLDAVLRLYLAGAAAGKRLKHLLAEIGEEEFRRRLAADPDSAEELPLRGGLRDGLTAAGGGQLLQAFCRDGQLSAARLRQLADFADDRAAGVLQVTANQNLAFTLPGGTDFDLARRELREICGDTGHDEIDLRVCPGSHECRVGLSATREVARTLRESMGPAARGLEWALSGCHNSCTQPQLAQVGIVTSRLVTEGDGGRTPRFDLYRPDGEGLNGRIAAEATLEELAATIRTIG